MAHTVDMLIAYRHGLELIRALRPVVEQLRKYSAEAAEQVADAASSMMRNIGEGSRRIGRDPRRFYAMAQASAAEVRAALETAEAWGWDLDLGDTHAILDRELAPALGTRTRQEVRARAAARRAAQRRTLSACMEGVGLCAACIARL
jgi:four helix bundle protein